MPPTFTPRLSVVMIVRDEEAHLPAALQSCDALADEIVVVDTGSRDSTPSLARAHPKVRFSQTLFRDFGQAKGFALEQARGDWVLALDADERLSPALAEALAGILEPSAAALDGYRIRRETYILGRRMTSMGLQQDAPLRLFRRAGARYNGRAVHEGVVLQTTARVGLLEAPLLHFTFTGIDAYLRKIDLYTTLELSEGGRRFSLWHLVAGPPSTFLRFYVGRGGMRDGFPGFLWASLTAIGVFLRDVKLWLSDQRDQSRDGPGGAAANAGTSAEPSRVAERAGRAPAR